MALFYLHHIREIIAQKNEHALPRFDEIEVA